MDGKNVTDWIRRWVLFLDMLASWSRIHLATPSWSQLFGSTCDLTLNSGHYLKEIVEYSVLRLIFPLRVCFWTVSVNTQSRAPPPITYMLWGRSLVSSTDNFKCLSVTGATPAGPRSIKTGFLLQKQCTNTSIHPVIVDQVHHNGICVVFFLY